MALVSGSLVALVVSLMLMAVVTILAAIKLKKNWIVFILIPLLVFNIGFSWHTIDKLWGTPRHGFPDKESEVLYQQVAKPWVYFLVKEKEEPHPTLYTVPWTKELEKKMQEVQKKMKQGKKVLAKRDDRKQKGQTDDKADLLFYEWDYKQDLVRKN